MADDDSNHHPLHHDAGSPMHLGLSGHFSPEDIHELLGAIGDEHKDHHQVSTQQPVDLPHHHDVALDSRHDSSTTDTHSSAAATTLKSEDVSEDGGVPEEAKLQARSERKRCREKQRRSDVNKQFAELTQLIQRIDAENGDGSSSSGSATRVAFNPSNRVDLIGRTMALLEKLHDSGKKRKAEISSLQQQLVECKKAGEDTAARLKEAMLGPPAPSKQVSSLQRSAVYYQSVVQYCVPMWLF